MSNFGTFDVGSALTSLKQARDAELATNFNEITTGISQQTTNLEDIYGAVQKGGTSIIGTGALIKGAISSYSKWKAKQKAKEKGEDEGDEEEDDAGTSNDDDIMGQIKDAISGESETSTAQPQEIELTELPADNTDALSTTATVGEEADTDLDTLSTYSINTSQTAPFLQRTDATRDVGETSEEVGEDVEETADDTAETLNDLASGGTDAITNTLSNLSSTVGNALSNATSTASNTATSLGNQLSSLTDTATNAVKGAVKSTTSTIEGATETGSEALETAGEIGSGVAGAGEEFLGGILDASIVGIPLGTLLNVVGGITLAGSIGAGIVGDITAGDNENNQINEAQQNYKSQLSGAVAGIQGKYGL